MAILAVAGRKGGIGKSTIAGNLAAELTEMGWGVIAIDADPQHSLALWAAQGDGVLSRIVHKLKDSSADSLRAKVRSLNNAGDLIVLDTPPGMPELTFQAALLADLMLLPCGASPLDLFAMKEALSLALRARAERRSKKPRIRLVPSRVPANTILGRSLSESLEKMGKKVLPPIGQRIAVAEAVTSGLTMMEYAPNSPARTEFFELARAVDKILRR
ncbi:MAG TPA: ParA family protein [Bryobacteraceae bacterium]|nr:ParA family protein [Bryobacteraceae bacterium]